MADLILASSSTARREMLTRAGVAFTARPARIDEAALRDGLVAEGVGPRDVADALAEAKARRIAAVAPEADVLGCDQVLALDGESLGKPDDVEAVRTRLDRLRGRRHALYSAAVIYRDAVPVWRHVATAHLTMRDFSDAVRDAYVAARGAALCESVGAYRIEDEGVRLFARIDGDHFTIRGLPLLALLNYLADCGSLTA